MIDYFCCQIKKYVGEIYTIVSTGDVVYIGSDLPKEYTGSKYTNSIKGTNAKAKAISISSGIPVAAFAFALAFVPLILFVY